MSRRQFLAASIAASLAAIALAKSARVAHADAPASQCAQTPNDIGSTPHRTLIPAPVDKRDCHHRVTGRS